MFQISTILGNRENITYVLGWYPLGKHENWIIKWPQEKDKRKSKSRIGNKGGRKQKFEHLVGPGKGNGDPKIKGSGSNTLPVGWWC